MEFLNEMEKTLNEDFNYSVTENGALGYRTTGKELLDLNFSVSSLRKANEQKIVDKFVKAFYENKELAVKWLFFARDIREGLGERRLFRVLVKYLGDNHSDIIKPLVQYVAKYGRYDDLWCLLDTNCKDDVIKLIADTLNSDLEQCEKNLPISLLSKWLPSENATNKETIRLAKTIRKELGLTSVEYRKILSKLRKYLNVIEVKMCSNEWGKIDYKSVPSKVNLLYKMLL